MNTIRLLTAVGLIGFLVGFCGELDTAESAHQLPLGTVSHLAYEASVRHGLGLGGADRLVCLAWYEATFKPHATNGQYKGLLQLGSPFWWRWAPELGYTYHDEAYDPYIAMDVSAYVVSQTGHWLHWGPVVKGLC